MTTTLGNRPSNVPPPVSVPWRLRSTDVGGVAWPPAESFIQPGGGANAETPTFNRPERFCLKVGASFIVATSGQAWIRYDYKLSLLINYAAYGADLNGIPYFRKANSWIGNPDPWFGVSIEGLFYLEANTNYVVRLLTAYNNGACQTFQSGGYWNMWAYTLGEGAY